MAVFGVWRNGHITVNGVDLSDHAREITLETSVAELPDNVHGDNTAKVRAGLEDWTITVTFLQDFAAAEVDETLDDAGGVGHAGFNVIVGADAAAVNRSSPCHVLRKNPGIRRVRLPNLLPAAVLQRLQQFTCDAWIAGFGIRFTPTAPTYRTTGRLDHKAPGDRLHCCILRIGSCLPHRVPRLSTRNGRVRPLTAGAHFRERDPSCSVSP